MGKVIVSKISHHSISGPTWSLGIPWRLRELGSIPAFEIRWGSVRTSPKSVENGTLYDGQGQARKANAASICLSVHWPWHSATQATGRMYGWVSWGALQLGRDALPGVRVRRQGVSCQPSADTKRRGDGLFLQVLPRLKTHEETMWSLL